MKTRYSSLISVKKNLMQKSERALQSANARLNSAITAHEISLTELSQISPPSVGKISDFLSSRTLLDAQRVLISYNEKLILSAKEEILKAQEQLKVDMIEYEKFNYLNLQEIKKIEHKLKLEESKELDEIALMTYKTKKSEKIR